MQQPAWNNNNFGYDTFTSPHRAGPLYLANAYEFLDSPGEWYLNPGDRASLSYIPLAGQNMSNVSVELPSAAVAGERRRHLRRAGAPHHVQRDHVHRHELAGPEQQPGLRRPADRRLHRRQLELAGDCSPRASNGCPQFEADPAELAPDARRRAGLGRQHHHLQRLPVRQPRPDRPSASATTPTPTPAASAWAPATSRSPVGDRPSSSAGGIVVGGVRPTRTTPATSGWSTGTSRSATTASTTSGSSTGASSSVLHDLRHQRRPSPTTRSTTCRTPACRSATAGAPTTPAAATDYANRGLYNYQPRYTTPTTASQQPAHRQLRPRRHAADERRRVHLHASPRNPSAVISENYCLRTNGYFGLYFDEGSQYYTATNNVFANTGTWATANYWGGENMGNLDPHQQLDDQRQHQRDQRRPRQRRHRQRRGHQRQLAVRRPGRDGLRRAAGSAPPTGRAGRSSACAVGPVRRRAGRQHHQRHPDPAVGLHRRHQPALDLHRRASS